MTVTIIRGDIQQVMWKDNTAEGDPPESRENVTNKLVPGLAFHYIAALWNQHLRRQTCCQRYRGELVSVSCHTWESLGWYKRTPLFSTWCMSTVHDMGYQPWQVPYKVIKRQATSTSFTLWSGESWAQFDSDLSHTSICSIMTLCLKVSILLIVQCAFIAIMSSSQLFLHSVLDGKCLLRHRWLLLSWWQMSSSPWLAAVSLMANVFFTMAGCSVLDGKCLLHHGWLLCPWWRMSSSPWLAAVWLMTMTMTMTITIFYLTIIYKFIPQIYNSL